MNKSNSNELQYFIDEAVIHKKLNDKYADKKIRSQGMYVLAKKVLTDKQYVRFLNCSSYAEYSIDQTEYRKPIMRMNSCGLRICPICSYKKSRYDSFVMSEVLNEFMLENKGARLIFLTLTVRNVKASELDNTIKLLNSSYSRLFDRKAIKDFVVGSIRKLEITYNDQSNTYHPHIHCLIAPCREYYQKASNLYISYEQWQKLWQRALRIDYLPMVNVKSVKKSSDSYFQAINELTKYATKSNDVNSNEEVFLTIVKALKGKQLITYSGIFKTLKKKVALLLKSKKKSIKISIYRKRVTNSWNTEKNKYVTSK